MTSAGIASPPAAERSAGPAHSPFYLASGDGPSTLDPGYFLCLPNANQWKGFTDLKMKCYTIPFQLTKIVAVHVTDCVTKRSSFPF